MNERWAAPELRLATNREFFELAEARLGDELDEWEGDWTDWWADGIGSAARAVGANRRAQGAVRTAQKPFRVPFMQRRTPAGVIDDQVEKESRAVRMNRARQFAELFDAGRAPVEVNERRINRG